MSISSSEPINPESNFPVPEPVATIFSILSFVEIAWCVTSSPIMTKGIPELNTMSAASGSTKILNSATGVWFPIPAPPPINTIFSILFFTLGKSLISFPIFVIGPRTAKVIFSFVFSSVSLK